MAPESSGPSGREEEEEGGNDSMDGRGVAGGLALPVLLLSLVGDIWFITAAEICCSSPVASSSAVAGRGGSRRARRENAAKPAARLL